MERGLSRGLAAAIYVKARRTMPKEDLIISIGRGAGDEYGR
jgi:hypothetical protein